MPSTATPDVPRIHFSAPTDRERLARLVLDNHRLLAVVPDAEIHPLFLAYTAATKAVAAARLLPIEGADVTTEVDAALRRGEEIDPAALMAKVGAAQAAREYRDRTVDLLSRLPKEYSQGIVSVLEVYADDYWVALEEDLSDLLDRAAVVVDALKGASTAEEAIDLGVSAEWVALKALARENAELRGLHAALLRLEDSTNFGTGSPRLARAYWAGLDSVFPDFAAQSRGEHRTLTGLTMRPPAYILAVDSVDHLLAAVRRRRTLRPHIGRADGAAQVITMHGVPSVRTPDGALVAYYGSERAMMRATFGDKAGDPGLLEFAQAQEARNLSYTPVPEDI